MQSVRDFVHSGSIWQSEEVKETHTEYDRATKGDTSPCPYFLREERQKIFCASTMGGTEAACMAFSSATRTREYKAAYCDTESSRCLLCTYQRKAERESE